MNFSLKALKLLTILGNRCTAYRKFVNTRQDTIQFFAISSWLVILSVDFHSASRLYTFYFVADANP